jgi:excisionase family DNA binding protein
MDTPAVDWPSIRDVTRTLDLSAPYVLRLIHRGDLEAYRTRIGWLVDPKSVEEWEAQRAARKTARPS